MVTETILRTFLNILFNYSSSLSNSYQFFLFLYDLKGNGGVSDSYFKSNFFKISW